METREKQRKKRKTYQKRVKQDLINKIHYLYYKKGLTIKQIAELLIMSDRTVSKYLLWESNNDT